MNTKNLLLTALALIGLAGCGRNTGYIIKPVSLDEALQETVIMKDQGLLVTDKIAVVDVDGMLMNAKSSGLTGSGENPVSLFIEKLDKAQADTSVRAIVLRINSPGGTVTASDIMHQHLLRLKTARHVPVVAVIEDVGASGAYYIACGGDVILAHPTSVTGSIGVIVQMISFDEALHKLGIDAKAITSGRFKDMASPLKKISPQDEGLLQGIVNSYYQRFLKVVCDGRPKLAKEKVRELADGRVYTGDQAQANGLVDGLGYVDDAIALAKKLSARQHVKVVMYHRPVGYKANAYSDAPNITPQADLAGLGMHTILEMAQPQFLYLWSGQTPRR